MPELDRTPVCLLLLSITIAAAARHVLETHSELHERGGAHFFAGDFTEAVADYSLAVAMCPDCAETHHALGLSATRLVFDNVFPAKHAAVATYHLGKALSLGSPEPALSYRAMGDVLQWQCEAPKGLGFGTSTLCAATQQRAARAYRQSLALQPTHNPAIDNFAKMLLWDGTSDAEAVELYRKSYFSKKGTPWNYLPEVTNHRETLR